MTNRLAKLLQPRSSVVKRLPEFQKRQSGTSTVAYKTRKAQAACCNRRKLVPACRSEKMWFCEGKMYFLQFHLASAVADKLTKAQVACRIRRKLAQVCRSEKTPTNGFVYQTQPISYQEKTPPSLIRLRSISPYTGHALS